MTWRDKQTKWSALTKEKYTGVVCQIVPFKRKTKKKMGKVINQFLDQQLVN